jgi:hypothetical protein
MLLKAISKGIQPHLQYNKKAIPILEGKDV